MAIDSRVATDFSQKKKKKKKKKIKKKFKKKKKKKKKKRRVGTEIHLYFCWWTMHFIKAIRKV